MNKIFIILTLSLMILGCSYATSADVKIDGTDFKIPSKYQGGNISDDGYELDNTFSIRCIDEDIVQSIGLWAVENDFKEDLTIGNHPVRHYSQYNKYVGANHSHAYFAAGKSVYEIAWVGTEIDSAIEKLIENTPESEISDDAFYNALDKSVDIYKTVKKDKLNQEAEYNCLEAKYQSLTVQQKTPDDTRFKEILLAYY